jgi:predicted MPP superfamily phosphohydrolase
VVATAGLSRHALGSGRVDRPLRVVQISDPHLGPWQPVAKLRRRLVSLLSHDPDLVLLTGDFLTMESAGTPGALGRAFMPLRAVAGRSFAILGNHDLECEHEVRAALEASGVRLLVDEEAVVETATGPVQIVGAAWVWRQRREHLHALLQRWPRRPGHLRLLLLHDPSCFHHVPPDEVDLTLSGHTHGGQLGLVSLGLPWTVLSRSRWPDHGLFGQGSNRLYVHRGTGFYGFPLRVGVPGEASLLEVVR